MAKFGKVSKERLATCDPRLQKVFNRVIESFDCTIIEGFRGKEAQNLAYAQGKSKLKWPKGKHNSNPSRAVDVMPYDPNIGGINWKDTLRMAYFAGFVMATAKEMGIRLRWGHDWDGDTDLHDQDFNDGPHYELID
jgi:hypothetical protein